MDKDTHVGDSYLIPVMWQKEKDRNRDRERHRERRVLCDKQ